MVCENLLPLLLKVAKSQKIFAIATNLQKINEVELRPFQFLQSYNGVLWVTWMETGGALMAPIPH